MKAVLSFYRNMMRGRSASVSSALLFYIYMYIYIFFILFYIFLPLLLAHHIHTSNHYFHRENALNKDTLEQNWTSYKDPFFSLEKAAKKILINMEIYSKLQHDLSFLHVKSP